MTVEEQAKESLKLEEGEQVVLMTILPNIINGAFWGFTKLDVLAKNHEELLNNKDIKIVRIQKDDIVIEADPDYFIKLLQGVDTEIFTESDFNSMLIGTSKARKELERFLLRRGKEKYEGKLGLYCINNLPLVTSEGITYPAFRVSLLSAVDILHKYGFMVKVGETWVKPREIFESTGDLFDSLDLSQGKTGVFIEVKCVASEDYLKKVENQMKEEQKKVEEEWERKHQ